MHHLRTHVHTFTASVIIKVFEEYYLNCFPVKEREEGMDRGMIMWKRTVGERREGERLRYVGNIKIMMSKEEYCNGIMLITEYLWLL
jgi:hypothetical protein